MTGQRPASTRHVPVLLDRCLDLLDPAISRPNAVVIDATLGMGGHSEAMLERFDSLTLIGLDRDQQALDLAGERLARFGDRVHLVKAVYDEIPQVLNQLGFHTVDGVLFDLGVSSLQLDEADRGFAYSYDAPLDMRMDKAAPLTAQELLATIDQAELVRIIRQYGQEKFAGRIASSIVKARDEGPLMTTAQLVDVIRGVVPAAAARTGGHPAKRTFQALRIAVNDELAVLERAIPEAMTAVNDGGRVVVMSYHSLEDGIVKQAFKDASTSSAPRGLPVELPEHRAAFSVLTRGTVVPTEDEIAENPRAASARLRAVERKTRASKTRASKTKTSKNKTSTVRRGA